MKEGEEGDFGAGDVGLFLKDEQEFVKEWRGGSLRRPKKPPLLASSPPCSFFPLCSLSLPWG